MFPCFRFRPRPMRPLLALILGTWVLASRAESSGYDSDLKLASTMIDIAVHHSRPLSLAEVFSLIEIETGMKIAFAPGGIVLGDEVVLEKAEKISLSRLLASVAAQRSLVFERRDDELRVRSATVPAPVASEPRPRPLPGAATAMRIKPPSPDPVARVAPVRVQADVAGQMPVVADQDGLVGELAGRIERIASGRGLRSRKEKDIAAAVRAVIAEVHVSAERKEQVLDLALDLVQAAAGVAPQFTETIANAAAFAPAVSGLKSAGVRLRAAAYNSARAPISPRAAVSRLDLPRERTAVIKAPKGETPDSFVAPSSTVAPVEPAPPANEAPRVSPESSEPSPLESSGVAISPTPAAGGAFRVNTAFAESTPSGAAGATGSSDSTAIAAPAGAGNVPAEIPGLRYGAPEIPAFSATALEFPAANPLPGNEPAGADNSVLVMEKFGVQGAVVMNSQIALRQRATVSADVLTSRDFGRFIATDIADIVIRMPGLSTTSRGSFAVVRGLAERYNPVMLDGIVMPSSDPERQSPELDIFPSRLVDAIVISKAYEPGLPGTSSGAGIDMRSKPIPEGRSAQVQFGLKFDEGYLKDGLFLGSGAGGKWDWVGLGVKDRLAQRPATRPEMLNYVRSPSTVNGLESDKFPLGGRFSFTYENRLVLNEQAGSSLGYGVSFGYERTASSEEGERATIGGIFNTLGSKTDAAALGKFSTGSFGFASRDFYESELEHRFGLLGTVGFAFNPRHSVALSAFWSQIGTDVHALNRNGLNMLGTSGDFVKARAAVASPAPFTFVPVSYTHLTLPTNREV